MHISGDEFAKRGSFSLPGRNVDTTIKGNLGCP
jgi:hypothetical protein